MKPHAKWNIHGIKIKIDHMKCVKDKYNQLCMIFLDEIIQADLDNNSSSIHYSLMIIQKLLCKDHYSFP